MQMMRHCRQHPLLHLIPSPSGFFVAALEGWGAPRRKIPEAAVQVSAILEPEGDSERRRHSIDFVDLTFILPRQLFGVVGALVSFPTAFGPSSSRFRGRAHKIRD
jgi:hypothetical protein